MEISQVTTKRQVVIPARIRSRHKIKKGTKVIFIERNNEILLQPMTDEYIDRIKGSAETGGKAMREFLEERKKETL